MVGTRARLPEMMRDRKLLEAAELAALAPYASKAARTRGRQYPSEPHPYRTAYQIDRDRIMYTTAFRRLQYKTQVFVYYEGDYYRSRLTHTSEAAQIARTVARALGANEDLAEAITLAHDLGHPPFGHTGEKTLDRLILARTAANPDEPSLEGRGFNHTLQSLRIVERLERRWPGFTGLNLTWETREGVAKHSTRYDHVPDEWMAPYAPELRPSIEAQIVNYADELTYSAHDLDDGLRSGMIGLAMPALSSLAIWQAASTYVTETDPELRRHQIIRRLVDLLITDLVQNSAGLLSRAAPASTDDVRRHRTPLVALSSEMSAMQRELAEFLYDHLYRHWRVVRMFRHAERVLTALFEAFEADYRQLPEQPQALIRQAQPDVRPGGPLAPQAYRVIADYLAGMTDRYALQEHRRLFDPSSGA